MQFETGARLRGENEEDLISKVISHRAWKNLYPVSHDEVRAEIERQICLGQERSVCMAEPGEDYHPLRDLMRIPRMEAIMGFTKAVFAYLQGGGNFADNTEISRRAEICRGCKFNRPAKGCSCDVLYGLVNRLVPQNLRKEGVYICGICGCSLTAKIAVPDAVVRASNEGRDLRFPVYCWQGTAQ